MNSLEEQSLVIQSVTNILMELCTDPQGVHILEKILHCFPEDNIGFIYEFIMSNFWFLAHNQNGLCVAIKIIFTSQNAEIHSTIQKFLVENAISIIQHTHANYVMQVSIEVWNRDFSLPVVRELYGKLYSLSMQKFSSNVIEKAFEMVGDEILCVFVNEVKYMNRIVDLMKSNYGNYVVQKALKLSKGPLKATLLSLIINNINKVGERKLASKWSSIIMCSMDNSGFPENVNYNLALNDFSPKGRSDGTTPIFNEYLFDNNF